MAKEMMIIFIYDTQMLQTEEDDPASAILYFHPGWVSDQQKTALCGQLMGTIHCIKSVLSNPKIVALQSGKFFVKEFGRYLMAVGTDRNIADWLLEHRAITMSSLITFFHQDIEVMSTGYSGNSAKLSAKLYQLFETYLKYLFTGGNIFSHLPSVKLPKSAGSVFLEAIQILECCQEMDFVLGGTLLYHNKVVATQLSPDLTKRIVLTDPYRIKCPAEIPTVDYELPIGVQLFHVYISGGEYHKLFEDATRSQNISQYFHKSIKKQPQPKKVPKEPVITAMKRDQSLIFTSVPEEEPEHHHSPNDKTPPVQNKSIPSSSQNRPKFLNLKTRITEFNSPEPSLPTTPFRGQVCSTPITDLSKVVHSKPLLICRDPDEGGGDTFEQITADVTAVKNGSNLDKIRAPFLTVTGNIHDSKKYNSTFDVREKLTESIHKSITMKHYKNVDLNHHDSEVNTVRRQKTIADPSYPIFRSDGTLVSHLFYKDYLTTEMELIVTQLKPTPPKRKDDPFKDFDSIVTKKEIANTESIVLPISSNREHRKSLTLPLKSLSLDEVASPNRRHSSAAVLLTPLMSKLSTWDERPSTRDATPIFTPSQSAFPLFPLLKKVTEKKDLTAGLKKCTLFICGQQDMVLTLLLRDLPSEDTIKKLWEICTEYLPLLEKQLHHCLDVYAGGGGNASQSDGDPYSYLYLDPDWDTVHRGGPWGSAELGALTYFHRDFKQCDNLTEILMRYSHGVIYGYQSGGSEIFYHQSAASNAGLPTPADPMGNVPLKARRRLERDHSIILL